MSEAFFEITVGDTDIEMSRDNTTIYRHLGSAALFDHMFVSIGEGAGAYMWAHHSQFDEVVQLAEQAKCRTVSNIDEPAECDVNAYVRHQVTDLEASESVPEEWV